MKQFPISQKDVTTIAIISSIAIGALVVVQNRNNLKKSLLKLSDNLFASFKKKRTRKAREKLGALIEDVRFHVKQNAAGLLQG